MIDALGYAAGVLAVTTFIPQIMKTLRTRSAEDLSMRMLLLMLLTVVVYLAYGILLRLIPVIIMLALRLVLIAVQVWITWRYRRPTLRLGSAA